jgi:hypothetical protein
MASQETFNLLIQASSVSEGAVGFAQSLENPSIEEATLALARANAALAWAVAVNGMVNAESALSARR